MPGSIRIRILDPAGARSLEVTIDDETPFPELIQRVASRFDFPAGKVDGKPVRYHLFHREGMALLPSATPISQMKIGDGDTLLLVPAAGQGGGTG